MPNRHKKIPNFASKLGQTLNLRKITKRFKNLAKVAKIPQVWSHYSPQAERQYHCTVANLKLNWFGFCGFTTFKNNRFSCLVVSNQWPILRVLCDHKLVLGSVIMTGNLYTVPVQSRNLLSLEQSGKSPMIFSTQSHLKLPVERTQNIVLTFRAM